MLRILMDTGEVEMGLCTVEAMRPLACVLLEDLFPAFFISAMRSLALASFALALSSASCNARLSPSDRGDSGTTSCRAPGLVPTSPRDARDAAGVPDSEAAPVRSMTCPGGLALASLALASSSEKLLGLETRTGSFFPSSDLCSFDDGGWFPPICNKSSQSDFCSFFVSGASSTLIDTRLPSPPARIATGFSDLPLPLSSPLLPFAFPLSRYDFFPSFTISSSSPFPITEDADPSEEVDPFSFSRH
mmetsp:Transcript_30827/g.65602  ORF Transcript_30827/g.65602 Transcript_30827/m.65602 type:complete len:246 (-) Transcript_30827:1214-1951(-)